MTTESITLDSLDDKANTAFPGLVVKKDLLRTLRSAYSVPMFVIEFLLGKYCASPDPEIIDQGMEFVRRNLAQKYVKPDEREIVRARVQQQGSYQIIDRVSVTLKDTDNKYWATLASLNQNFVTIDESVIQEHDRLLMGGVWAEVTLRYDPSYEFKGVTRPFFIDQLKPIQLSSTSIGSLLQLARPGFTRDDLKAHVKDLGLARDPRDCDLTVQAINLNQAREGAETALGFFISMVSALLNRPVDPTTIVAGEMTVSGLLQKVTDLQQRLELAREAGAKRVLIPSENKRDLADIPDDLLSAMTTVFYPDPLTAAIKALGLE